MSRRVLFPLIFGLSLTSFTAYSVLDTLYIEKVEKKVNLDDDDFFKKSFSYSRPSTPSRPKSSSSSNTNSSINLPNSSNNSSSNANSSSSNTASSSSSGYSNDRPSLEGPIFKEDGQVELTDHSYVDSNINIQIYTEVIQTQHMKKPDEFKDTTIYLADVRIRDLKHLRTALAKDSYGKNITENTSTIARRKNAIFAINGDSYGAQETGYVVRNGQLLRDKGRADREDLVIYADGSFETFKEGERTAQECVEMGAYQVFSFGPTLVKDGEVSVKKGDEVNVFSDKGNQRCAIGIVEPLHYLFAINDARTSASYGMQLYEMGEYMKAQGAEIAYNLDGGGSATFFFNDRVLNNPTTHGTDFQERGISDIVYIA